ncbi:MAG: PaaI family thioesterase [Actinomycetia bacterium]|nr:PaaI family thioesterase [Actinomycetes bacterium]
MSIPDGFTPYTRPSPYLELIGPLYEAVDDPAVVGLRVDQRHTNARGFLHAGVLVAVADVVMGHTAHRVAPSGTSLVTASLTTDFPGSAQLGDWITGVAAVRRVGRRLAFTTCEFTANDRLVLASSGVFATIPRTEHP